MTHVSGPRSWVRIVDRVTETQDGGLVSRIAMLSVQVKSYAMGSEEN